MDGEQFNLDEVLSVFIAESNERLQDMEDALLELENNFSNDDAIGRIFRAAHTIKGSSGMFGFNRIMDFTHIAENLLDQIRSSKLAINTDIINLLLECRDFIGLMLDVIETSKKEVFTEELESQYETLQKKLEFYLLPSGDASGPEKKLCEEKKAILNEDAIKVTGKSWHISLRFKPDVFLHAFNPYTFISYLESMGEIVNIKTITEALPPVSEMDPEKCYLGFEIGFTGNTSKEELEDIFNFLKDDCTIRILPPMSDINEYVSLIKELPESPAQIGEILKSVGSLTENELQRALDIQRQQQSTEDYTTKKRLGEIIVDEGMIQQPIVEAALDKQEEIQKSDKKTSKSIRIDATKLDTLVDMLGELVLSMARLSNLINKSENSELRDTASLVSILINDVRENSMNIRLVRIDESFKRFERVVRDLSRSEGKEVDLVISCGDTELDKTLVEKINDPVMHLVRNSIDHGIDTPDKRKALGKNPRGKVIINAFQETGSVVIEVRDDGKGLEREKILQKALERGLVSAESAQNLSDDKIYSFIFEPGFSTAEKVTNISGRGVGMDVVKNNIEQLRGNVTIQSKKNEGTTVRLQLPLTLAIIDGFLVEVGGLMLVFPLGMVIECLELSKVYTDQKDDAHIINMRGEFVPFMRLRDFFKTKSEKSENEYLIIGEYGRRKAGFTVDKAIGEIQVVVKPIGKVFNKLRWISGATILGDGRIALILDVPRLVQHIRAMENQKVGSSQ